MHLSVPEICKVVEKFCAIDKQDVRGPQRTRELARVGQIAHRIAQDAMPLEDISTMRAVLNGAPKTLLGPPGGGTLANSAATSTAPAKLTSYCGYVPGELTDSKSVHRRIFGHDKRE